MKRINKLLALLLCAVMIFSIIPVHGFASETETADTNALTQPEAEPAATSTGVVQVEHDGTITYYDNLQKAFDGFAPSNNTYDGTYVVTLLGDTTGVSKTLTYPANGVIHVVLDLNGYTVSAYDTTKYVIYISLKEGAAETPNTFTLKDSSGTNAGKITGGYGGVNVNGKNCTFYFQGGTITGNGGTSKGGGILMGATTFLNMTGGVVTGNSATGGSSANSGYGGGILVNYGSITGGLITGNVATAGSHVQSGRGGGLSTDITRTSGYNTLTIANGVIYGNTAGNAGDDVMVQGNGMSGTKYSLSIGTDGWYIDGWKGTKATAGNGEAARYDETDPVPYTDGGFADKYNISIGLKYVEDPYDGPIYTITYTDGVDGEEIFADQTYKGRPDKTTPAFKGTPERYGYTFAGWSPEVEAYPTQDTTYTAQWTALPAYTVTYTDGVEDEELFADQVYNTYEGYETPAFVGTPSREHYIFTGWTPEVADTVTGSVTYTATWREAAVYTITYTDGVEDEEIFPDQVFQVEEQQSTPTYTFGGKRPGYKFSSWTPTVAKTVTGDATYTAKWTTCSHTFGTPVFDEENLTNTYTCTTCGFVKVSPLAAEINGTRYENLQAALNTLTRGTGDVTVKLLADTTECVSLTWTQQRNGFNLTIDLNGYTITGTGSASVMTFKRTGSTTSYKWNIIIDDSSAAKTGTVTGGGGTNGGAIAVSGVKANDSLTIKGGNFKNNNVTNNGGVIYASVSGYDVIIDDGVFEENTANASGGAIYAPLVIVNGGTFKNNSAKSATYGGGALYVTNTLTINGGTIIGNTAVAKGGGIYVTASKPIVNVTAGKIYGNTAGTYGDDFVFSCTGSYAPTLNLISAADMGVDGVSNWYVDGYCGPTTSSAGATERDANHVQVYEAPASLTKSIIALKAASHSTVTYTDGVEGEELFADQVYNTYNGYTTPAFDGTPAREDYTFGGWNPELAETVTADVTYTAVWAEIKVAPPAPTNSNVTGNLVKIICDTDASHTPVTKGWLGANTVYPTNAEPVWNEELGAWTVNVRIDSISTYYVWDWFEEEYNDIKHQIVSGVTTVDNHNYIDTTLVWDAVNNYWKTLNNEVFEIHTCCKTAPDAPVASMLTKYQIKVTGPVDGQDKVYFLYLDPANVTIGAVQGNRQDGFTADITVKITEDDSLQAGWIAQHAPTATVDNYVYDWDKTPAEITFTLRYTGDTSTELKGSNSGDWALSTTGKTSGTVGEAYLAAALPPEPEAPNKYGTNVTPDLIKVICDTDEDHAPLTIKWQHQSTKVRTWESGVVWSEEYNSWIVPIRIDSVSVYYVWLNFEKEYNEILHPMVDEDQKCIDTYLKWDAAKQLWVTLDEKPIDVHVACKTTPDAPTSVSLRNYKVQVIGIVNGEEKKYAIALDLNNVEIGAVQGNREDGFTVTVTVKVLEDGAYESGWIAQRDPNATVDDYSFDWSRTPEEFTFTLGYTGDLTGNLDGTGSGDWEWIDKGDREYTNVGKAYLIPAEPDVPDKFGKNVTPDLIKVICDADEDHAPLTIKWQHQSTKVRDWVSGVVWSEEYNTWIVPIRIDSVSVYYVWMNFEKEYNEILHPMVDEDQKCIDTYLKWDAAKQLWVTLDEKPIDVHVACKTTPDAPTTLPSSFQIQVFGPVDGEQKLYAVTIPAGGYTLGEVYGSREEGFFVDVTVTLEDGDTFISTWIEKRAPGQVYVYNWEKTEKSVTFTLKYNRSTTGTLYGTNKTDWAANFSGYKVGEAYVMPAMPAAPTYNNVDEELVAVICDSDSGRHETVYGKWYPQHCQTTSDIVWNAELNAWTVDVRIGSLYIMYVDQLEDANNGTEHTLVEDITTVFTTLKWDATNGQWVSVEPIELHTTCRTAPIAPAYNQVKSYQIKVWGDVNGEEKAWTTSIPENGYTLSEVYGSREEGFFVDVTITLAEDDIYQQTWIEQRNPGFCYDYDWTKTAQTVTFTLKYNGSLTGTLHGDRHAVNTNYDWVLANGKTYGVVADAYVVPVPPSAPQQKNVVADLVTIICDSDAGRHAPVTGKWYPQHCKTTSNMVWNEKLNTWTVDIRIGSLYIMYVDQLEDANNGTTHELVEDITTVYSTLKWDAEQELWVPIEDIELHTTCRTAPIAPAYKQLKSYQIKVYGDVNGEEKAYTTSIPEGSYTLSEVRGSREEGFFVDLIITLAEDDIYQQTWIEKRNPGFCYDYDWTKTAQTITITLKYNGSLTGTLYGDRHAANTNYDWVLDNGKTFGVVGEAYVKLATYTLTLDANGGKVDPETITVTYSKAIGELPEATRTNYIFVGWFDAEGNEVTAETIYNVAGDSTITAKWIQYPGSSSQNVTNELFTIECSVKHEHSWLCNWFGTHVTFVKDSVKWNEELGRWEAQCKIGSSMLSQINSSNVKKNYFGGIKHYYDETNYTFDLYYDPNFTGLNSQSKEVTGMWLPAQEYVVPVYCYTEPSMPDISKITSKALWVRDTNSAFKNTAYSAKYTIKQLIADTYTLSEMYTENGKFYVDLTITDLTPYINALSAQNGKNYILHDWANHKSAGDFKFTLTYTGSATDYKQDGTGWALDTTSLTSKEKGNGVSLWLTEQFTVTYTDGVENAELFADQSFTVNAFSENGGKKDDWADFSATATPEIDEPARTGYTFAGWTPEFSATVNGNVVYTAVWTANEYTLTLDANGGEVDPATLTVTFDATIGTLPVPTRTGYTFAGWVDAEGNAVTADTIYTTAADTTITAQWTANNYILTLDANGGEVDPATLTVTFDAVIGTLPVPTRTGYTFTGWVDAQGNAVTADTVYTIAGDSTVTAQWVVNTYIVSFNPNGGAAIDSITVTFDAKYGRLPSSALTGFSGGDSNWYLVDENGNVTDTKITRLSIVSTARDHQLFVVRKILNPTVKIALTVPGGISNDYKYYIPGNSTRVLTATVSNMNADELVYSYQWYKDDVAIEGATESVLTLPGNVSDSGTYKVVVTATLKDGSTVVVTNESASGEKTQKVQIMRAANTLRLNENYGEIPATSDSYFGGAVATIRSAASGRVGYTFAGWNTAADGSGETYQVGAEAPFPGDNGNGGVVLELFAQWTPNEYTLTLDANSGTVDPTALTVTFDAAIGTLPTPTRTGYTFAGWVDAEGNAVTAETVYTTAADSTITAQWVANTYTVTLIANGGKVSPKTITVTFDAAVGNLPIPKRDGYTFGGWTYNYDVVDEKTIYTIDGDINLYAYWIPRTYTLTLDAGEGTVDPTALTVTFDAAIGTLPTPERTGYTFTGWVDAKGNAVTAETVYTNLGDMTITAQWTAKTYTVTLENGEQIEITYGEPIGILPTPEQEGHTFEGWFDADGNPVTADTVFTGDSDLDLTARWSANGYAIELDPGEGKLNDTDPDIIGVVYGAPVGQMPVPTYEGYTFEGWYDEDGVLVDEETVYLYTENITVYAEWEQIPEEPVEETNNYIIYIVIALVLIAGTVVAIVVTKKRAVK